MKKSVYKYLVAITSIVTIITYLLINSDFNKIFYNIKLNDLSISILLCLSIFSISGLKISCTSKLTCRKQISLFDIITLPIAMNLWGYIIPIKGGMFYSVFYLKKNYNININEGAALSIFIYSITLSLFGLILLIAAYFLNNTNTITYLTGTILILNLFLILILNKTIYYFHLGNSNIINNAKTFIIKVHNNLLTAYSNPRLLSISLLLSLIHLGVTFLWYQTAAHSLNLSIPIISLLLLVIVNHLSMIIKILPGNVGFTEVLMGVTTSIVDGNIENGLTIAIFLRSINLIITSSIGVVTAFIHLTKIENISFRSLSKILNSSDNSISK